MWLKIITTKSAKKIPLFTCLYRFLKAMVLLQDVKIKQVSVKHFSSNAGKAESDITDHLPGLLSDGFIYNV
jgi:hypothetical protein